MSSKKTPAQMSFVTNFNPADLDGNLLLVVARNLKLDAKIGPAIGGLDGARGFYVPWRTTDLTEFWTAYYAAAKYIDN